MSRKRSGFAITSVRGGAGGGGSGDGDGDGSASGSSGPSPGSGSSRFRLVRLPATGEPLRRGRWTCRDFYEREAAPRAAATTGRVPLSLDSRLPPPPRAGSPPLRPVPPAAEPGSGHLPRSLGAPEGRGLPGAFAHLVQQALPRSPPPPRPASPGPRPGGGTEGLSARLGLAGSVLGIGDDDGAGSGMIAIDNKIEQAMDLVKSHLLLAVREEVELLREQIKELSERQALLERENGLLRALATPQQLARLRPPHAGGPPA